MSNPQQIDPQADPVSAFHEIGKQLRRAREDCNYSIPSAASALHLPPRVVAALEEGEFTQFQPVYVRGYLRNYTRLIKLDIEPILEAYNLTQPVPQFHVNPPPPQHQDLELGELAAPKGLRWVLAALALPLLVWAGLKGYEGLEATQVLSELKPEPQALSSSGTTLPLPALTISPAESHDSANTNALAAKPTVAAESLAVPPKATPSKPVEAAATAGMTSKSVGEGPDTIAVHLSANAWVEIRDQAGQRLAYETIPADEDRSYAGKAPFKVILGNSPATRIEFNGQPFDQPKNKKGTVARFTVGQPNT